MKTLSEYAAPVKERLKTIIPMSEKLTEGEMPALLTESMRYSLLAGGKRLRPAMFLSVLDMFGTDWEAWVDFACAIEMIHSYSLIHDDLPGMDDDTMRRGKPTNHVVFGVGQAILAGDGLLNFAFETMLRTVLKKEVYKAGLEAIFEVATGAGVTGMIGGQVIDLSSEHNRAFDEVSLSYIQRGKTACMFIYPIRAAAKLSGASPEEETALTQYAEAFGRMFQAADDLLDVIGNSNDMGKTLGKDAEQGKLTMTAFYGVDGTNQRIKQLHACAVEALKRINRDTSFLSELVDSMLGRTV